MKPGRIAGKGGMRQKTAENSTGKRNNVENFIEIVVFAVLVGIASAVTLWLFYRQCVESMLGTGLYHSDMKAYILEMQGLDSGYSFPYPILFKLAAVIHLVTGSLPTGTELAMALATMLLNSVAMIALKIMLDRHVGAELRKAMPGKAWLPGVLTGTVAVSLFFVSMVYPPTGIYLPGIKYKYLGVFTANPFHNATYMAARPFAILAFFKYAELMPLYEQDNAHKEYGRDYILFSVYLLLATDGEAELYDRTGGGRGNSDAVENVPQQIPELHAHHLAGSMLPSYFCGSVVPVSRCVRPAGGTGGRHRFYAGTCVAAVLRQSSDGYRSGCRFPDPGASVEL